jgi:glycosyltransferase involved in cell wall biosynthesis
MKILFVTAHAHAPQTYGGMQTSLDQLCRALLERGHNIEVLASLTPYGLFSWATRLKMEVNRWLTGHKIAKDTLCGYPVWRCWRPREQVEYVAGKEKPDLIVITSGNTVPIAQAVRRTGIPMLAQLHNVEFYSHGGEFKDIGNIPCVANSKFTAEKYRQAFGIESTVIYPFVSAEKYRTKTTRENVTFINPLPPKGSDLALEIARQCPDIPFCFVRGWPLSPEQNRALLQKLSRLPNVTLLPLQQDMKRVYEKCKILLMPSLWEETFGRVATEAHINGIPAIASNRGGLAEAVGPGGILLDPEGPIETWVTAVRKLWQDDAAYAALSAEALTYSHRPEMNFERQIKAHEKALLEAAGKQK